MTQHGNVAAVFANDERRIGAVLVGADGSHSSVRGILFNREKSQLDPVDGTWAPTPWHTRGGRITLAGDAAHTMAPHSQHGLNSAILDAYDFVDVIKGVVAGHRVRAEAVPSYSREVAARGAEQVETSRNKAEWAGEIAAHSKKNLILEKSAMAVTKQKSKPKKQVRSPANSKAGRLTTSMREIWSGARLWVTNSVENLDRGAREGTAQTGWVELGHREYGRRHFAQD